MGNNFEEFRENRDLKVYKDSLVQMRMKRQSLNF
jgi:hypothetical protein